MNNNSSSSFQNQTQQHQNIGLKRLSELLPIAIAITVTNGLVFVMFYRRRSLRTASNHLLLGLAMCDFLTGAVNIPYFIIFSFGVIPLGTIFSYMLYVSHTLMAISAGYHILMITADKYFAITRPLRHHLVTKTTVCKQVVGVWMISAGIATVPYTWRTHPSPTIFYLIHSAFCLLMVFFAPYMFMVYAYTVMFRVISKRTIPELPNDSIRSGGFQKKINDRKCTIVFAVMAAIYAICWLPYFTVMLIDNTRQYLMLGNLAPINKAFEVITIIRYITSVTNPLLYTFFKRDFWHALKNLLMTKEVTIPSLAFTKRVRDLQSLRNNDYIMHHSSFLDVNITLVSFSGKVNEAYSSSSEEQTTSTTPF